MSKFRLSDMEFKLGTFFKIFMGIGVVASAMFGALNVWFLPRLEYRKEIGKVQEHIKVTKENVEWIKDIWQKGIKESERGN